MSDSQRYLFNHFLGKNYQTKVNRTCHSINRGSLEKLFNEMCQRYSETNETVEKEQ